MVRTNTSALAGFSRDDRGTVAIIFALVLVPLLAIVSLAIDYGRALKVNSQLYSAADAATAALLHKLPANGTDLTPFVRMQLDANLPDHLKDLPFELVVSEEKRTVELSLNTDVPTALMGIVGVKKLEVAVVSRQIIPKAPSLSAGLPGFGKGTQSDIHAAEQVMRRAASSLGSGGSAAVPTPAPEDIKKLSEQLNKQLQEALQNSGHGDLDLSKLRSALGR